MIVCALLLVAFIRVAETLLFLVPSSILASISSKLSTGYFDNPST